MVPPTPEQDRLSLGGGLPADVTLRLSLPVDWVSPSIARDRVRAWLRAHRWSPAHGTDLVLAVNEAVSNSIEHGHGVPPGAHAEPDLPPVDLDCRVTVHPGGHRHVVFTVVDHGTWQPPQEGRGAHRGHGTTMMRAATEDMSITHGDGRTTVTLRSRVVPPPVG